MEIRCPNIASGYSAHGPFRIPMSTMLSFMVVYMAIMCTYIVSSYTAHEPFSSLLSGLIRNSCLLMNLHLFSQKVFVLLPWGVLSAL